MLGVPVDACVGVSGEGYRLHVSQSVKKTPDEGAAVGGRLKEAGKASSFFFQLSYAICIFSPLSHFTFPFS